MTFKGPATRSIRLLELRFHWSIQVDFMHHVIYVNRQSHVINCYTGGVEVCHSNKTVAAWIEKLKLESR